MTEPLPDHLAAFDRAVKLMQRAVRQGAWEKVQTHESLIPKLREETEELAAAIEAGELTDPLRDELGDLLLQVLFHAEIAARDGRFTIADVADAFVDKIRRRAPFFFEDDERELDADEQDRIWQEAKRRERESSGQA